LTGANEGLTNRTSHPPPSSARADAKVAMTSHTFVRCGMGTKMARCVSSSRTTLIIAMWMWSVSVMVEALCGFRNSASLPL
jgi:hypothetical protein